MERVDSMYEFSADNLLPACSPIYQSLFVLDYSCDNVGEDILNVAIGGRHILHSFRKFV